MNLRRQNITSYQLYYVLIEMDPFETLSHLTRPEVEEFPVFKQQPPCIDTRYIVKCHDPATVGASDTQVQTLTWFTTPVGLTPTTLPLFEYN